MIITQGSTNVTVPAYFVDDDGGTAPGEPTTGLLWSDIETGGSASYQRQGAVRTDFTLKTQTVAGAHDDGGFIQIDATEMKGNYRLDVPDAAFASGADFVIIHLRAAAAKNTLMRSLLVTLTAVDLRDSVRGGMTALPNAAADGAGGLPISDDGGLDMDILADWVDGGRLDLLLDLVLADTGELQTDLTDGGRLDLLIDLILADTGELQTDWANGGRLDALLDLVLADTGELQTDWANGGRLDLLIDLILADTGELQTDWANGGRLDLLLDLSIAMTDAGANKIADHIIRRSLATAAASSDGDTVSFRSILGMARKLTNKISTVATPTKLTIYEEDDTTVAGTQSLTSDASANPVTVADTD